MKRGKLTMKKTLFGFLIMALAGAALLLGACEGILDKPETQQGIDADGYQLVRIDLVCGEDSPELQSAARTTFPEIDGLYYTYAFSGGPSVIAEAPKPADGNFKLLVGNNYTVTVKGYTDSTKTTQAVEGTATFNVPLANAVKVNLSSIAAGTNGKLDFLIQYDSGATATVTLTDNSGSAVAAFASDLSTTTGQTKTDTAGGLSIAKGSYFLNIVVTKGGKTTGLVEAIYIVSNVTTKYRYYFTGEPSAAIPIKSVSLKVPVPKVGAAVSTMGTSIVTGVGKGDMFDVTSIIWTEDGATISGATVFAASEAHSAAILLTAKSGFTFTGLTAANAKINDGATITGISAVTIDPDITDGTTATLNITFPATIAVTTLTVTTQPTKLTYTTGNTLDLSGIKVKLTGAASAVVQENIPLSDFALWGITASPVNGASLNITNSANPVNVLYGDGSGSLTGTTSNLTVNATTLQAAGATVALTITGSTSGSDGVLECVYKDAGWSVTSFTVSVGGNNLTSGNDYSTTLEYASTDLTDTETTKKVKVGTVTVTVNGLSDYGATGSKATSTFRIVPKSISGTNGVSSDSENQIALAAGTWTYDGTAKEPTVSTVKLDMSGSPVTLTEANKTNGVVYDATGGDYTITYLNNINAKAADATPASSRPTVKVTGRGNYTGDLVVYYAIAAASVTGANFETNESLNVTYNGTARSLNIRPKTPTAPLSAITGAISDVKYAAMTSPPSTFGAASATAPTNAGTYKVTFDVAADGNYALGNDVELGGYLVIQRKQPDSSDLQLSASAAKTYNGSAQALNATIGNDIVFAGSKADSGITTVSSIKYNGSTTAPTNPGEYTVTIGFDGGINFYGTDGITLGQKYVIGKKSPAVSDFDITGPKSGGSPWTVSVNDSNRKVEVALNSAYKECGTITVKYRKEGETTTSDTVPAAKGKYIVTFDVAGGANFISGVGLEAGTLIVED